MKTFVIILLILLLISISLNFWQYKNIKVITNVLTDTLVVVEQLPPDTVISEVVKYKYKTIINTDVSDSLKAVLDSVMAELNENKIREYVDTVKFETGDSLHTKIKGILFDKISYTFFPTPKEIQYIHTTTKIDSRDDVWFVFMPMFGMKIANGGLYTDLDFVFMSRKTGIGTTFGYDWNTNYFYKGVKLVKVWDVPKIKFLR